MRLPAPALLAFLLVACGPGEPPAPATPEEQIAAMNLAAAEILARPEQPTPEVEVQHVLVAFAGKVPGVTRIQQDAEKLAAELWQRARAGEDWDALVREYSDDEPPGMYTMTTDAHPGPGEWPRGQLVAAFTDVAWRLEVGEIGVAVYEPPKRGPFGWHIIKRLR